VGHKGHTMFVYKVMSWIKADAFAFTSALGVVILVYVKQITCG